LRGDGGGGKTADDLHISFPVGATMTSPLIASTSVWATTCISMSELCEDLFVSL
jgi:hypothetical protein